MKRLLVAGAAGALLATAALPARAYPTRYYEGGCGFNTLHSATVDDTVGAPDRWYGEVYAVAVPTDMYGIPLPTSTISIACELHVNGVLTATVLAASGIGAAVGAGTLSYEADVTDWIEMCEHLVIDDEDFTICEKTGDPSFPPRQVEGLLNVVLDAYDTANDDVVAPYVDPSLCPVLSGLAPGVPGQLDISPEGDVETLGSLLWDCPPYEN